ncbi:MAG: hypothetical protein ACYTGR_15705 [Planctomycetota bacterium]|jgi:hypothetical protein
MERSHVRFVAALLLALFLSPLASAQIHKDDARGFSFKPPKDYNAVALTPNERLIVAKYQDPSTSYGGEQGYNGYNSQFIVRHFAYDASDSDDEFDPMESGLSFLEAMYGYYEVDKDKKITIARTKGREMYITPANGPIKIWCTLLPQDDGLFLFEGSAIDKRFDKEVRDFSKAAKTFKRFEKADTSARDAELSQMDEQERFLQKQIDKLQPGWEYLRTPRYLFLYNAEKNFVKELADRIESMRDEYERLYPPDRPIEDISIVRVCNSKDEYHAYGGPSGSAGYWYSVDRELVFYDARPRTTPMLVANHEALHQYIYYYYGELAPHSWYNEGHGDYFSGAKLTSSHRITGYGNFSWRVGLIKEAARLRSEGKGKNDGACAPLKELMHFHHSEYYGSKGWDISINYATGWALVHMLRESKALKPKWERILPEYLENLLAARHEVAEETMRKKLETAEKVKEGSSEDLSHEVTDYYNKVDTGKVQDRAYDKTFADWTDEDWEEFDEFFLRYVEKL